MSKLKTKRKDQVVVYISGPMRDNPDWNYPLFHEVACAWLDRYPFDKVLNPAANFDGDTSLPVEAYMQKALEQALEAQFIILLPGWEKSEGAKLEVKVGKATNKFFYLAKPKGEAFGERTGWEFLLISHEGVDLELKWDSESAEPVLPALIRMFDTGATRDTEDGKLDYEAFLSPLVLERYAQYMHKHRERSDGSLRAGDDWQKGIPVDVYMKSLMRHVMDAWHRHRYGNYPDHLKAEALCGVLFNAMGYLHELEKRSEF